MESTHTHKAVLEETTEVVSEVRDTSVNHHRTRARPMQKKRFIVGLMLSSSGIGLMLTVAAGALQTMGANGRLSLPIVGLCMVLGLMMLGGGFGLMATAAPTFDDDEFDRLMQAGNTSMTGRDNSQDVIMPQSLREESERTTTDASGPPLEQSLA